MRWEYESMAFVYTESSSKKKGEVCGREESTDKEERRKTDTEK